jgi:hypothetical protein
MPPPASSTSWKPTTAASWPTAWAWARPSPRWPSSSTTSCATSPCWCCAPRSWPTTGSPTTATSRPTSSPRTASTTTCCATPTLQRTSGESFGTPLNRINWGNYDLVVIDESHNFRNNDAFKEQGDALPEADEQGHQAGREDQGADALGHPGQQPLQRPAQPAGAGLRRRLREPEQEAAHRARTSKRSSAMRRQPSTPGPSCRRRSARPRHPRRWTSTSSSCWTA